MNKFMRYASLFFMFYYFIMLILFVCGQVDMQPATQAVCCWFSSLYWGEMAKKYAN